MNLKDMAGALMQQPNGIHSNSMSPIRMIAEQIKKPRLTQPLSELSVDKIKSPDVTLRAMQEKWSSRR